MKTTLLFLSVFLITSLFGQNVYIPDANFKACLVDNPLINTNGDTEIQVSEASSYDGVIDNFYNYSPIYDATGIEAFTALTYLDICYCNLTSLDVSACVALESLRCWTNSLTSINVSGNIALKELLISVPGSTGNDLTSLDVSACVALEILRVPRSSLTSLDVSQNPNLLLLDCADNQLTSLDISQNTALTELYCNDNQLASLDFPQNSNLTQVTCSFNQLTSLSVPQNPNLYYLDCSSNQLTILDVENITLPILNCADNQLTNLDLAENIGLSDLNCSNNDLNCLNVKSGYNSVFLNNLDATENPNLLCIEVDDAIYSTAFWQSIDPQTSFSEDCDNDCSTSTVGLTQLTTSKNLIQILDMMGRETSFKPNTPLIYVYDDGSTEKVFSVEY